MLVLMGPSTCARYCPIVSLNASTAQLHAYIFAARPGTDVSRQGSPEPGPDPLLITSGLASSSLSLLPHVPEVCSPTSLHCLVQTCYGGAQISPLAWSHNLVLLSKSHQSHPRHSRSPRRGSTKSCPCAGTAAHGAAAQMVSSLGKASAHNCRLSSPSSRSSLGVSISSLLLAKDASAGAQQIDAKWLRTLSLLSLEKRMMRGDLIASWGGEVEQEVLSISPWGPVAWHVGMAHSCARWGSEWTSENISLPRGCSNTETGFFKRWWMSQACKGHLNNAPTLLRQLDYITVVRLFQLKILNYIFNSNSVLHCIIQCYTILTIGDCLLG